ncbi:MAG TPA: PilW family protein [Methylobacter sp.]|jgi:type IV pilus assembly protein PilW
MNKIISSRRNLNGPILQFGSSLIEVMISLSIGLFLLTGLAVLFLSNRQVFITQSGLAQLQNNPAIAMNIISNVVQSAGYYTNPQTQTQIASLSTQTVTAPLSVGFTAGQAVFGGSVNASDSIAVRSVGAMNCTGGTSAALVSSTFTVDNNNNLQCSINSQTSQTLVSGVSSMALLYGVDPLSTGSATRYVTAANVTNWNKVVSVRVTMNFVNPLYSANQSGQSATLAFTKVIGLMGQL